ncbi:RraA family protein [Rhodoligotrophos ferricapiens]|uniref:RraA family protein n=1 Tax=Rhodoligotrophos ferricapiens TaxID=3069264 RepID=UPI00315C801D
MAIDMNTDYQRPPAELVDRFRTLASSTVGNVLDDLGIDGIILNLKPVVFGTRIVGPAYTVKEISGVRGTFSAAEFGLGAVIDTARSGDVVVIDNAGQQVSTWGGIASLAARNKGVGGLIVDGGVRDADEINEFGFPVFSRHVVPLSGKTRVKVIATGGVVKIDGVRVSAGDIIVADSTGIVCVPLAKAEEIAARAEKLDQDDRRAIEEINKGLDFTTALSKFPKL